MALRRRPDSDQAPRRPSLVAAARRLQTAPVAGQTQVKVKVPKESWQDDAWDYFDAVPEVKHAARFVGNAVAKVRLYPAVPNPDDPEAPPIPLSDERVAAPPAVVEAARAELDRLRSDRGGQAEIQRQIAINLEVAGECYVVGTAERQAGVGIDGRPVDAAPERWEVHSISELDTKEGRYVVRSSPKGDQHTVLTAEDTVIRLWQRHPRWADLPDCALAGLLTECETLHTLALQKIGESLSKRNNGFLLVPNELVFSSPNKTRNDADGDDPDDDPMLDALSETMQGPIADPASPSSVQPTLVRGPAEALKEFRHVLPARVGGETIDDKIESGVARLARGIDLPVEATMGHQSTTFANAAQVDRDTFDDYLEPRCVLMVDALTFGYYRPNLAENPAVPSEWADRIVVWYDETPLITQPDPADSADEAHKNLTISDSTYRRVKGYDDQDAPDDDELLRRTGLSRGILTGDITLSLLALVAERAGIDLTPKVSSEVPVGAGTDVAPPPEAPPADPAPAPADGAPAAWSAEHLVALAQAVVDGTVVAPDETREAFALALAAAGSRSSSNNYGKRLLAIDQQLRTQLLVATEAAMERALERAGNKLRSRAGKLGVDKAVLARVPATHVAATIGPTLAASAVDDVLDGAWDDLERQFRSWASTAQAEAVDLASRIASGFGTAEREALQLRQAASIDEAWDWMRGSLDSLAQARLFDPTPAAAAIGEVDAAVSIPAGLVRQAMSRAGGATGLVTDGRDAWVALYPDGSPVGGVATGEDVLVALRIDGVEVEGYRWVYGPAGRMRPFEPHAELDGVEFVNFDDAVLANSSGWPDDAFYFPGDHGGCLCDYELALIVPDGG